MLKQLKILYSKKTKYYRSIVFYNFNFLYIIEINYYKLIRKFFYLNNYK